MTVPAGIPDPNPDNNTVTVIGTPAALTDLSVTKTDGQTQYVPGKPVTYTIMVTNAGPSFASQAAVDDTLDPAIISSATWTAVFTGTGSTGTASGTGSISENIDLAVGGTAVYTVIAQTLTGATGSLTNTVTRSLTHSLAHSLAHSLTTHSLTRSCVHSLTYSLTCGVFCEWRIVHVS